MNFWRNRGSLWILTCACVLIAGVAAWSQSRKAGLYDTTTNMTWQQSPFPEGMGPGTQGPHKALVCVTQEQVDKFGGAPLPAREGCSISDVVKRPDGFTATMTCNRRMNSKGPVEATFTEDGQGKIKVHMTGTMNIGPTPRPVEYTIESTSVFKSADCGSVKPDPIR